MGYTFSRLLREEILTDAKAPLQYKHKISVLDCENGSVSASAEEVSEGEQILITAKPDQGYKLKEVFAAINGIDCPIYENENDEGYILYNVLGTVEVRAEYERV